MQPQDAHTNHDPPFISPALASALAAQGNDPQGEGSRPASASGSRSISPTTPFNPNYNLQPPSAAAAGHTTPLKFAATTNAFNLAVSPTSSTSSREGQQFGSAALLNNERSPPQAGTSTTRRLRRPSMLSLAQPTGPAEVDMSRENSSGGEESNTGPARSRLSEVSPTDTRSHPFAFGQPAPRLGGTSSFFASASTSSSSSSPNARTQPGHAGQTTVEAFKASPAIPPLTSDMDRAGSGESGSPMEMELGEEQRYPLRFLPSHLQTSASRRKGKGKMEDADLAGPTVGRPGSTPHPEGEPSGPMPFTKKPLPASLVATLISEHAPLEHEIQSEARLQRFIHSHPARPPLTPRMSKSNRGRFPEMADDDDDDDIGRPSWRGRQWVGMRSDSDSDTDDEGEPVNSAFAAGMDLDRPMSMSSSSSSAVWPSGNVSESGKMTPNSGSGSGPSGPAAIGGQAGTLGARHPTPPHVGTTFGGAPRPARMSFGQGMVSSPGTGFQLPGAFGGLGMGGGGTPLGSPTIERLELGASPGAVSASSPGLMQYRESQGGSASVRPGKRKAGQQEDRYDPYKRPRGSSPSFAPMSPSQRTGAIPIPSSPFASSNSTRRAYARPLSSRSRQASPALSIGSTSGVLSTSLGNGNGKGLGSSFIPTGPAATHAAQHAQGPQLGSLGLLSLANVGEDVEGEGAEEGKSSGGASRATSEARRSGSRGQDQDRDTDAMEED